MESLEQQIAAGLTIELVPNRLYFTSAGSEPHDDDQTIYLGVPFDMVYIPYFADFGPLNLGHVVRYCRLVAETMARASNEVRQKEEEARLKAALEEEQQRMAMGGGAAESSPTSATAPRLSYGPVVPPIALGGASAAAMPTTTATNANRHSSVAAATTQSASSYRRVVLFSPHKTYERANAACLAGCFCVSVLQYSPEFVNRLFTRIYPHFLPFRDASYGVANFNLYLVDCWSGFKKAWDLGWVTMDPWVESMGVERHGELMANAMRAGGGGRRSTSCFGRSKSASTSASPDASMGSTSSPVRSATSTTSSPPRMPTANNLNTVTQDDINAQFRSVMHPYDPLLQTFVNNTLTLYGFDLEAYEFYEKLENGDWNWIVPGQIMAFSSPIDKHPNRTAISYVPMFRDRRVQMVVRLNERDIYNELAFVNQGIRHVDCNYADGSVPCDAIVDKFLSAVVPLLQHTNEIGGKKLKERRQKAAERAATIALMQRRGMRVDGVADDGGDVSNAMMMSSNTSVMSGGGAASSSVRSGSAAGGGRNNNKKGFKNANNAGGATATTTPMLNGTITSFDGLRSQNFHSTNGTRDLIASSLRRPVGEKTSGTAAKNIRQTSLGGAVAVHCKAGLGRTGTLISIYLMLHYHFTARECIGWLRICRPGCVLGEQQAFLEQFETRVARAREQQKQQAQKRKDNALSPFGDGNNNNNNNNKNGTNTTNNHHGMLGANFLGDGKGAKEATTAGALSPTKTKLPSSVASPPSGSTTKASGGGGSGLVGLGAALGNGPLQEILANGGVSGAGGRGGSAGERKTPIGLGSSASMASASNINSTTSHIPLSMRSATPTTNTTLTMLKSLSKLGNAHLQRLPMNQRATAPPAAVATYDSRYHNPTSSSTIPSLAHNDEGSAGGLNNYINNSKTSSSTAQQYNASFGASTASTSIGGGGDSIVSISRTAAPRTAIVGGGRHQQQPLFPKIGGSASNDGDASTTVVASILKAGGVGGGRRQGSGNPSAPPTQQQQPSLNIPHRQYQQSATFGGVGAVCGDILLASSAGGSRTAPARGGGRGAAAAGVGSQAVVGDFSLGPKSNNNANTANKHAVVFRHQIA